jgi:tetratricopeptide (TPR) repeat protein
MTASNAATKALWKLIWPVHLSSDYSYNQIKLFGWHLSKSEDVKAILSALFIAGTLILAARCYKRHKAVSFFIVFYWIAYGPTSNFLIDGSSIMAERFLYLPLVAFSALLVLGVDILASRFGISLEFDLDSIRRSWPRLVPHAVFLLILLLCGVRSYQRNFDWQSEVTISQSAIESSPNSFRGYFLLAFAYYDSNPIEKIDRIIELAEKGIAILDPLPNEENYSRMYLHLGMYYGMKGESSEIRNADGSLTVNDTALEWFKKSARVLERGTEIDQAVSDANYARELKRGNTNIPDAGLPELYLYLGMAYAELGFNEKALEAFKYMRHLEPREPQAYLRIASAQLALRQFEDAAVSLIQCVLLDPQRTEAWQSLTEIYSQINREPVPAVQVTDGHERLQEDNRMVQLHLLYAYRDFIKTARFSKLPEMLRDMRDDAVNSHHFNPGLLDDALYGKAERPKPPSPAFHVFGKKLLEK